MEKIKAWAKKETVLCISALAALLSMLVVPPTSACLNDIDWRVLGLLWSLMTVVAGFRASGVFDALTYRLLTGRCSGARSLSVLLVLLPFFVSMAVTNDVALLTFVPFTLELLATLGCTKAVIPMLVLQTIAANLGSMATPVGNPQNLFLYGYYGLGAGEFFAALLPLTALSLVCLCAAALPLLPRNMPAPTLHAPEKLPRGKLGIFLALFAVCLLSVFRILPWWAVALLVLLGTAKVQRELLQKADYALLVTFICFFLFSGNLGRMPAVSDFLRALLERNTLLTAAATSQIISNVPAAVLLAPFTSDWRGLLLGVDIGGLGTPVASLASLITLKLYCAAQGAKPLRYLGVFTLYNVIGLAVLLGAQAMLG